MERAIASTSAVGAEFIVARERAPRAPPVSFPRLIVGSLDFMLRRVYGVVDIDPKNPCLLRIQSMRAPRTIGIDGETIVRARPAGHRLALPQCRPSTRSNRWPRTSAWVCRFRATS